MASLPVMVKMKLMADQGSGEAHVCMLRRWLRSARLNTEKSGRSCARFAGEKGRSVRMTEHREIGKVLRADGLNGEKGRPRD